MTFLRPLVSGSQLLALSVPEEYLVGFFLEITSGMFPYATLLGSTVDTRLVSVYEAFGRISRSSCVCYEAYHLRVVSAI